MKYIGRHEILIMPPKREKGVRIKMDKYKFIFGIDNNNNNKFIDILKNGNEINGITSINDIEWVKYSDIEDFIEESKETIGNLNQELLVYREQNDRLQRRFEELEKENEILKDINKAYHKFMISLIIGIENEFQKDGWCKLTITKDKLKEIKEFHKSMKQKTS